MTIISRRALLGAGLATAIAAPLPALAEPGNQNYPTYVPTGKPPRARFWKEAAVLNQFGIEACESFAMVGAYLAATKQYSVTTKQGNRLARKIWSYRDDPKNETAIAGINCVLKMQELGMVNSWSMPQNVDDLVDAICYHGPVSISVYMTSKFANTTGRLIYPGSTQNPWDAHAMVATAYVPKDKISGRGPSIRLRNSWGKGWGQNGSAWITVADLKRHLGPRPAIYHGYHQDMWLVDWKKP